MEESLRIKYFFFRQVIKIYKFFDAKESYDVKKIISVLKAH